MSAFCNSIAGDEYIDGLTKLTAAVIIVVSKLQFNLIMLEEKQMF